MRWLETEKGRLFERGILEGGKQSVSLFSRGKGRKGRPPSCRSSDSETSFLAMKGPSLQMNSEKREDDFTSETDEKRKLGTSG